MTKNRYVNTRFWDDDYIGDLLPFEKLLFIYLITNSNTNILGIYEITDKKISFDTGIPRQDVKLILERFQKDGKVKRIKDHIVMLNFVRHQDYASTRYVGALRIYQSLPDHVVADQEVMDIKEYLDTLYIPDRYDTDTVPQEDAYPIDTVSIPSRTILNSESESLFINKLHHQSAGEKMKEQPIYEYPKSDTDPELIEFFVNNGSTAEEAADFYHHFNAQGWVRGNGQVAKDWMSLAIRSIKKKTFGSDAYNAKNSTPEFPWPKHIPIHDAYMVTKNKTQRVDCDFPHAEAQAWFRANTDWRQKYGGER